MFSCCTHLILCLLSINIAILGPPSIGWNIQPTYTSTTAFENASQQSNQFSAPPLPPRNGDQLFTNQFTFDNEKQYQALDRRKLSTKLYENVVIRKTYDTELVAFFEMVKALRSEYKFNDLTTNVGHVVAAEFSNIYPEKTSIKLLVHPAFECMITGVDRSHNSPETPNNYQERGEVEGYGHPVVFTCDSKYLIHFSYYSLIYIDYIFIVCTTVEHVIMHVFCSLEGQIKGTVNDYILKVSANQLT